MWCRDQLSAVLTGEQSAEQAMEAHPTQQSGDLAIRWREGMNALLIVPALLLIAIVFGYPMLRYGWLSFHADSVLTGLIPVPNGGANWQRLLADARFWQDTLQTGRFAPPLASNWFWLWPSLCCSINAGEGEPPSVPSPCCPGPCPQR